MSEPGVIVVGRERKDDGKRRIVNICNDLYGGVCALCSDGTLWRWRWNASGWERLPDIPQDEKQGEVK